MKKLFTLLFLICGIATAQSQTKFLTEDFTNGSGTTPPTGWTQNQLYTTSATTDFWEFSNPGARTPGGDFSGNFAIFDSDNYSNNAVFENIALESPSFSTQGYDTVWLKFDVVLTSGGTANGMVEVFDGESWETIHTYPNTSFTAIKDSFDVSEYLANNCKAQVRFRWTSNSGGWWAVDNIEVYSYGVAKNYNAAPKFLVSPTNGTCGSPAASVNLVISNHGLQTIGGFPVTVRVFDGDSTKVITQNAPGNIAACRDTLMSFTSTIDLSKDSNYTITIITQLSNDQTRVNSDTLIINNFRIIRPPIFPSARMIQVCGVGNFSDSIALDPDNSAFWYPDSTSKNVINRGKYINIQNLSKDSVMWVETFRKVEKRYPFPNRNPNVGYNAVNSGLFMDVIAKSDILIDSLEVDVRTGTTFDYEVYITNGSYQPNTTNAAAWTRYYRGSRSVSAPSANNKIYIGSLPVNAGDTIGIYLWNTSANTIEFTSGPIQAENDDMKYYSNQVNPTTSFSGILNNFGYGGTFYYSRPCFSNRVAYRFDVDPKPSGAALTASTPFNGTVSGNRDVVAEGDTISYELTPPTGYSNSDFGVTWTITDIRFQTLSGNRISSGDTFNTRMPSASGNGYLAYRPSWGWADSTFYLVVTVQDLKDSKRCDTLVQKEIFIAPTPFANFAKVSVCQGSPLQFDNLSTISSGFMRYVWDFGDGTQSNVSDPVKTYDSAGVFQVKLSVFSDFGIEKDTTIAIQVFEIPKVSFRVLNACKGQSIEFQNQTTISGSTPITYSWDFGDGQNSTAINPMHEYTNPGTYSVTLKARANGCEVSESRNATQFATPKADFGFAGQCQGSQITFSNQTTINSTDFVGVLWTLDSATTATSSVVQHIFRTSGTKQVKLVAVSQFNCADSITKSVTVIPGPVADFTLSQACNLKPTYFANTSVEPSGLTYDYTWTFGSGLTSKLRDPSIQFTQLGKRSVTLIIDASNRCKSTITKEIEVKVQPRASFSASGACSGENIDFRNSTTGTGTLSYLWNFGDGTTSTLASPQKAYNPSITTTYNVELIATIEGACSDTARNTVLINENPVCTYTYTSTNNGWGRQWRLSPTVKTYGSSAYTWQVEGQGVYNQMEPVINFSADGSYKIRLLINTQDRCQCEDTSGKLDIVSASIDEPRLQNLVELYPNPGKQGFNILVQPQAGKISLVQIKDINGRLIGTFNQEGQQEMWFIPAENLSQGMYFIDIYTDRGIITQKWMKQ